MSSTWSDEEEDPAVASLAEALRATEHLLATQLAVTEALGTAASGHDGIRRVLETLATTHDWQVANLWWVERDPPLVRCREQWHAPGLDVEALAQVSSRIRFIHGDGLPGRVWRSREPIWIENVDDDGLCPRFPIASALGLRAACAFPVRRGGAVIGVVELFAREPRARDERTLGVMQSIGAQLGQFVGRDAVPVEVAEPPAPLPAPVVAFVCDADGRVLLHEGGELARGRRPEQVLGRELQELYPDPVHPMRTAVASALSGETVTRTVALDDGALALRCSPVFDASGQIAGVIALASALGGVPAVRAEDRLRNVLAHAPIIVFAIDVAGRLTLIEGREVQAALGACELGASIFACAQSPALLESCRLALAGQEHTASFAVGPELHFDARYQPQYDETGRVIGVVGVCLDVSERQRMESALRRSEMQLIDAERVVALGSLAGGVAHQLDEALGQVRQSLGEVLGLEVRRHADAGARRIDLLESVRDGVAQIERVAAELRRFAHLDEGPVEVVEMPELLDSVLRIAAHEVRPRARVLCDYDEVPPVRARPAVLRQVFLNLVVNAAQSLGDGDTPGEIRLATRTDELGRVVVEIADSGPGMSAEVLARVFEPFYSGRPAGQGVGLGLAIARDLVTAMGGEIVAESARGAGSTFRVVLPAESRHAAEPKRPWLAARVLIVSEERPLPRALVEALSEHEVVVVASGRAALELLRHDRGFDVVLCDLMMAELSGIDVYESLLLMAPWLARRMVFLTGDTFSKRAAEFLEQVPNLRVARPLHADELANLVRAMAEGSQRAVTMDQRVGTPA